MQCVIIVKHSKINIAGWSSLVARRAHNPKVVGSNPAPATTRVWTQFASRLFSFHSARRSRQAHRQQAVGLFLCVGSSLGDKSDRCLWQSKGGRGRAAVEIWRSKQQATDFGHRNWRRAITRRSLVQIQLPQPPESGRSSRLDSFLFIRQGVRVWLIVNRRWVFLRGRGCRFGTKKEALSGFFFTRLD